MFKHTAQWRKEDLQTRYGIPACNIPKLLKQEQLKAWRNGELISCPREYHKYYIMDQQINELTNGSEMLRRFLDEMGENEAVLIHWEIGVKPEVKGCYLPVYAYLEKRGFFRQRASDDPYSNDFDIIEVTSENIEQSLHENERGQKILFDRQAQIDNDDPEYKLWKYLCIPKDEAELLAFSAFMESYLNGALFEVIEATEHVEAESAPEPKAKIKLKSKHSRNLSPSHPVYQMRKDKKAAGKFVEEQKWNKHPEIEALEMARRINESGVLSRLYNERVIAEKWIKEFNPRYESGALGRKKKPK